MFRVLCLVFSLSISVLAAHADTGEKYILDTGDTIKIVVFEEADMSFEIKIDESGVFAYPYMGEIQLSGKSTEQVENDLKEGLINRVLVNPNISVSIVEYRSFSIGGEVTNPGSYPYEPGLTVKKAINIAGGVTDWATGSKFKLDRASSRQETGKESEDSLVYPGDVLTILPRRF